MCLFETRGAWPGYLCRTIQTKKIAADRLPLARQIPSVETTADAFEFKWQIGCKNLAPRAGWNAFRGEESEQGNGIDSLDGAFQRVREGLRSTTKLFTMRHVPRLSIRSTLLATAILAAGSCVATAPARPQTDAAPKIGAIHVHGLKVFTEEQVIAATGLKPGQTFDPKQLNAVAERLGKSGAFPDVTYSYVPQDGKMAVDFKVEEGKFRPCDFDNFVWLSDAEITTGLERELPLYNGMLPETGDMLDDVARALEKLSQEKGVTVSVSRMVGQAAVGDPNWRHLFVANGVNVTVQSLRFAGNQFASEGDLQKVASLLVGRNYSKYQVGLFGSKAIAPYYRNLGYLEAKAAEQSSRILSHAAGSNEFEVEVTFAVTEGGLFRWGGAEWSGNQAVAASVLDEATGMKANEIANGEKIEAGWVAAKKEYSKSGYLDLRLDPRPVLDTQARLVHYKVGVTEGPQYHMGHFTVTGVTPEVADKVAQAWKLKSGDVYDGSYGENFMKKDLGSALLHAGMRRVRVAYSTTLNRQQHVVDVTVSLS